jgi:hypothetical protein
MSDFKTAGARKAGLSEMIRKMDAAQGDVRDNGFTLGWDIIASYSEKEINKLLADRYKKVSYRTLSAVIQSSGLPCFCLLAFT